MGIDAVFFQRLAAIGTEQGLFPGSSVAILGDCRFQTAWATGDNQADLARFARELGLQRAETLDIMGKPSVQIDLHQPLPEALAAQFDVIIDAGTVHCCFDVAAVLRNCLGLLKDRGSIFHLSALTGYFGRAYYCFNPLLLKDFYQQNGFDLLCMESRVPSAGMGLARWRHHLHRLLGHKFGMFSAIKSDGLYLEDADRFSLRFGSDVTRKPALIPNDAVIMVAARRERAMPFARPIPSFFAAQSGRSAS
ncbi:MAG TPA: class I SAM-dependent methyltransferase [Rhizomicrobium sp.]|jgi:SAM-dependent methyltransferase